MLITTVLIMSLGAEPPLEKLKDRHLELGRQSTELSRQGKYTEAADLLEKFAQELKARQTASTMPVAEKADAGASRSKFLSEGIAILRQRAAWAAKANTDFVSAQKLIIDLLSHVRWDVDTAKVQDPRVQALLVSARKLDPKTKALFAPRKVKVVVVDAPTLSAKQRASYATQLASDLSALGLVASASAGDDEFHVTVEVEGPVSAHLIGDDVDECTLKAKASWKKSGLGEIDLEAQGFGHEDIDGDCVKQRLAESSSNAARAVLLAWAGAKSR